ncbi:hypothetical protein Hanom_Chr00s017856g01757481 [Helianthus anomalus]
MDPNNNTPSLLKLIEDYDPIFLKIPYDFATLLWGEQPFPYGDCFTKVVRDSGVKKNDYLLLKAIGPSTLYLPVFKSCLFENSFISKIISDDTFTVSAIYNIIRLFNKIFDVYGLFMLFCKYFSAHGRQILERFLRQEF